MRRAYSIWIAAVAVYVLAVFHRTSLSVAGLVAADRFEITASQLSTFTMIQLLVYAGMQIPVGLLLDRFGPRRLLLVGLVVLTVAQVGFAFSSSYAAGVLARVFVGAGDAMVFISVLRLVSSWFPPLRIPVITQFTGFLGQLGSVAAAVPMTIALREFGWTHTYLGAAGIGVVLGIWLFVIVHDTPEVRVTSGPQVSMGAVVASVRTAWREPGTQLGLWTHFTSQFSATVLALLWGYPYFVRGEGLSPTMAGVLLTVLTLSTMVAGPFVGLAVAHKPFHRSSLVLGIIAAIVTVWTVVLLWPGQAPLPLLVLLVVIVGLGGPGSMVAFDFARTFNPSERLGSATGIVNQGGFVASLLAILGIGVVLDLATPGSSSNYSPDAFAWAMSVQYLLWGFGGLQIWRFRRRTRTRLAEDDPDAYARLRHGPLSPTS